LTLPASHNPGQQTTEGRDPNIASKHREEIKKKSKVKTKTIALTVGTWNVRTLLNNKNAERPCRRTVLVARELAQYNVDIAALSETRFAEECQLTEIGAGYSFL
jgi:hypothetical protein